MIPSFGVPPLREAHCLLLCDLSSLRALSLALSALRAWDPFFLLCFKPTLALDSGLRSHLLMEAKQLGVLCSAFYAEAVASGRFLCGVGTECRF